MTDTDKSINNRIAAGAFWTILMRLGIRALGVISVIILARILVPEDFGIVAKASMVASFLELITQFGLETALIQNQKAKRAHYDTVWTIHVIRGTVIAVTLVILAKPAAAFFNEPVLGLVLLFNALASFLTGLENIGVVDFRRDLKFDRDFRFNITKKLIGFTVTVSIAVIWKSYWAFVIGGLCASTVGLVASFLMSSYRPKLALREWRSLFHFSKWIFVMSIAGSISSKMDTFILSRFSTTEIVGRYTVAHEIAGAASTELAMPIARATMPGLAKLSDAPEKFRATYTLSMLLVMLVAIPSAIGLSALSVPITHVVLGEKWGDAAILVEILAIFGIMRAIYSISASAFLASGAVKTSAILSIVNLFIRGLALGIGFSLGGVVGLAWGVLCASVVFGVLSLLVQQSLEFIRLKELFFGIWRVALAAAVMYLSLTFGLDYLAWELDPNAASTLLLEIACGMLVYIASLACLWFLSSDKSGPESTVVEFVARFRSQRNSSNGGRLR